MVGQMSTMRTRQMKLGKCRSIGRRSGRSRNAIVPPALGSMRSKRELADSAVSKASDPPRVTTLNVPRVPAASASWTLRTPGASVSAPRR